MVLPENCVVVTFKANAPVAVTVPTARGTVELLDESMAELMSPTATLYPGMTTNRPLAESESAAS